MKYLDLRAEYSLSNSFFGAVKNSVILKKITIEEIFRYD